MTGTKAELVRRMYVAFHGGDFAGALAHYDLEVEVDATASLDGGTGRGREELGEIIGRWVGGFEQWSEEIEEVREFGSRVFVLATQRGRGGSSGIEIESRYAVVYEVRGELIARMTLYGDPAEALAAARG